MKELTFLALYFSYFLQKNLLDCLNELGDTCPTKIRNNTKIRNVALIDFVI
jgi:hypothetical protein